MYQRYQSAVWDRRDEQIDGVKMSSALVDKFFNAVMNKDMDTVRSCFHENIVGVDHATGKVSTGVEENIADVQEWITNFSDVKITSRIP